MSRPRSIRFALLGSAAVAAAAVVLVWAAVALGAQADGLRGRIQTGKERERQLSDAAAQLGQLAASTARQVSLLHGRVQQAQGDLARARTLAAATEARLGAAQARARRLRRRLGQVRARLAVVLRTRYTDDRPDLVTVVLDAHGFSTLLSTVDYLRRVEHADSQIVGAVRRARVQARRQQRTLARLAATRRATADAVRTRRDALAGIEIGLSAREASLARARGARLAALSATRTRRAAAERELAALLAAQRRSATTQAGPGGPWAVPWSIVQCESGGQNLPPNGAGASGYYQILPATWKGLGGSTAQAYQASKAEQDRLAAKLWAGGAGRGNWTCASLIA